MISNEDVKAGIIQRLKITTAVIALVDAVEIREYQWKGTEFTYPNIRVRLLSNVPMLNDDCNAATVKASIQVFTEDDASFNADDIAGVIAFALHGHTFTSHGISFIFRVTGVTPAVSAGINGSNVRTWRSEVLASSIASA